MTTAFWQFPFAEAIIEGFLKGLVLALLAIIAIWAVAELGTIIITQLRKDDNPTDLRETPKNFHDKHAT